MKKQFAQPLHKTTQSKGKTQFVQPLHKATQPLHKATKSEKKSQFAQPLHRAARREEKSQFVQPLPGAKNTPAKAQEPPALLEQQTQSAPPIQQAPPALPEQQTQPAAPIQQEPATQPQPLVRRLPLTEPVPPRPPVPSARRFPATNAMSPTASKQGGQHTAIRLIAICLAPVAICINFTNYGSLIPLLQDQLHVNSSQIGLFSTLLFLGIALTNIPGGILSDRFGARATMLGSFVLISGGSLLFPLIPDFTWMVLCRAIIGLGSGAALVAGSHATAELGKHEALGQGLNGGVAQLGAGLGLFVIPQLMGPLGWQGALFAGATLSILTIFVWLLVPADKSSHAGVTRQKANPVAGIRSPVIWALGLSNMGTFGLSNAISAWLAVYFTSRYGLPIALAALLGSLGLFAGMIFRPLGGVLLGRSQRPLPLIRIGTIMAFSGIGILALPVASLPLAFTGLFLLALGTTLPYASIFRTAASVGRGSTIGAGVAQGLIAVLASPAAIAGPPLIGLLLGQTNNFPFAFGAIALLFPAVAVIASLRLRVDPTIL